MFGRFAIFAATMMLASCTGGRSPAAGPAQGAAAGVPTGAAIDLDRQAGGDAAPAAVDSAPVPVRDSASIAGQWDVASFEGYRPRRLSGTIRATLADFSEEGVALRIECNYSGRAGTIRDGRFIAAENNDRGQTVMSCGPEANAREARFFSFFDRGPIVERLGPDRLRLRAGSTELILARPSVRRLDNAPTPDALQGRWRMVELTRYLPGGGYSGIGLSEVPGRIVISGDRLFYSRCAQYGISFRLGAGGRLEKTGGTMPPAAPAGCRELEEPAPARGLPAQWDMLRLLHASPTVERSGDDALLISNDQLGLLITQARCESLEQSDDHRTSHIVDCASPE